MPGYLCGQGKDQPNQLVCWKRSHTATPQGGNISIQEIVCINQYETISYVVSHISFCSELDFSGAYILPCIKPKETNLWTWILCITQKSTHLLVNLYLLMMSSKFALPRDLLSSCSHFMPITIYALCFLAVLPYFYFSSFLSAGILC